CALHQIGFQQGYILLSDIIIAPKTRNDSTFYKMLNQITIRKMSMPISDPPLPDYLKIHVDIIFPKSPLIEEIFKRKMR
ncbi:MAG TPA: hypothetical protein VHO70_19120, partial [Chitinispirillaceae bacterium]|nr:hypothetical protein [Chitinispirillaceae bacterium]